MLEFRPVEQQVFTALETCKYLRLDVGREDNEQAQLNALDRLVDQRKLIKPTMYRKQRLFRKVELDRFLEYCQQ